MIDIWLLSSTWLVAPRSTGSCRFEKTLRRFLHTQRELTRVLRDSTAWCGSTIFFVVYVRDGSCYEYVVSGSSTVYLPVVTGLRAGLIALLLLHCCCCWSRNGCAYAHTGPTRFGMLHDNMYERLHMSRMMVQHGLPN